MKNLVTYFPFFTIYSLILLNVDEKKASNSIQYPFSFSFSWFLHRIQSRFHFFFVSSSLHLFFSFFSFLADNSNSILIIYIIRKAAYLLLILLLLFTVLHMRIGILWCWCTLLFDNIRFSNCDVNSFVNDHVFKSQWHSLPQRVEKRRKILLKLYHNKLTVFQLQASNAFNDQTAHEAFSKKKGRKKNLPNQELFYLKR